MAEMANELLLYAAENGSLEGVKAAMKAGADIDCDQPDDSDIIRSGTPLYHASFNGYVDIVKLLLRKGASVAKRTRFSFAPLHSAANGGRTEVVDLLVQHGATLDIRDAWQYTPLMCASMYKHVDTVRRLIELGARADLTDGPGRSLVAQRYCELGMEIGRHGSEECLKLLEDARKSKLLRCCNPKCGKPGYRKTLKLCAGCKLTRYCSRDCQKQHWSVGHKKCCGHDAYTGGREQADSFTYMAYEKVNFTMPTHILEDIQQNFCRL